MIFAELNTKVLLDIFNYLDLIDSINLAGTCVKMRDVAQLHYIARYRIFNLQNFLEDRCNQAKRHNYIDATIVLKHIGHTISALVTKLDETQIGSDLGASIRTYCDNVKSLKIVGSLTRGTRCGIYIEWMKNLNLEKITLGMSDLILMDASETSTLHELVFCWPSICYDPEFPCIIQNVFERNCNITSLHIPLCEDFDYEIFLNLKSLKSVGLYGVCKNTLAKVASKLQMSHLVKVEIDYIRTDIDEVNAFLTTLAGNAPKLNELSIDMCLQCMADENPLTSLRLLYLTSLRLDVTYRDLHIELPKMQPNLKHLDLAIYGNIDPIHQIISLIQNLDKLEIFHMDIDITYGDTSLMLTELKDDQVIQRILNACSTNRPALRMYIRHNRWRDFLQVKLDFKERKSLSEKLSKMLTRTAPNVIVAPRPIAKVGEMFTDLKQKLTTDQQSFVVYRVQCKTCGKFYIGETTWCLCDRFKTHESDVRNRDKNPKKTALVKHVVDTGPNHHEFDYNRKEILKKVRKKGILKIHEANQIILHGNQAVNFKSDAAHISPVFYNIIKKNSKLPTMNPSLPPSYVPSVSSATDVLTVDTESVNNNNNLNRNTKTKYNLRNRN